MTADTKPVTIQAFMTVALAYTNPGIRVVIETGSGLSTNASSVTVARSADSNAPSVSVTATTPQIGMVCLLVLTSVLRSTA